MLQVDASLARRYILGLQGLWPGRRWRGLRGAAKALIACELVQMDPLNVIARSHDLVLHSRVLDYTPVHLDRLLYERREFFDAGGNLQIRPMRELPYWRVVMRRKASEPRWARFAAQNGPLLDLVRAELRARGPLGNRDLDLGGPALAGNYRGRKQSALALYYLWLTGEVLTHHRVNFERVHDFRANIAPPEYDTVARDRLADSFLLRKLVAHLGWITARGWLRSVTPWLERQTPRAEAQAWLDAWLAAGDLVPVQVAGEKEMRYVLPEGARILTTLAAGRLPRGWAPLDGTTTDDEVRFLAPLDIVSARGRAQTLFDFEYIWEVYKPAHRRRWGYYVLPILWGDRLVARLDPKLDRATNTLHILGFWPEDAALLKNRQFKAAYRVGLERLAAFVGAREIKRGLGQP
jgi:uncharacterized protein YcaQ